VSAPRGVSARTAPSPSHVPTSGSHATAVTATSTDAPRRARNGVFARRRRRSELNRSIHYGRQLTSARSRRQSTSGVGDLWRVGNVHEHLCLRHRVDQSTDAGGVGSDRRRRRLGCAARIPGPLDGLIEAFAVRPFTIPEAPASATRFAIAYSLSRSQGSNRSRWLFFDRIGLHRFSRLMFIWTRGADALVRFGR
jgi:hypothetical protein